MAVSARVEAIDRDVALLLRDALGPQAQSKMFAEYARGQLKEGERVNQSVFGRIIPHKTFVDGVAGANEDQVRPSGVIVYEFELLSDIFVWIADQLKQHSPVGGAHDPHPGLYKSAHTFFVDGKEVAVGGVIPKGDEYIFVSITPYSRKIEQGSSQQASDGVYQAVAVLARQRFGNQAKIEFTYRGLIGASSGSGTLVNPLHDPTRSSARGRSSKTGTKAYNKSDVRYPCIIVRPR